MNTRHPKCNSSLAALSLLGLGVLLSLATGSEPAGAATRIDSTKPFCVTTYRACKSLQPTGLARYDFCDGSSEYVGSGTRSECYTAEFQGDCL